jgi:hypothetical protein
MVLSVVAATKREAFFRYASLVLGLIFTLFGLLTILEGDLRGVVFVFVAAYFLNFFFTGEVHLIQGARILLGKKKQGDSNAR